jgi:exosortase/archaeosortase family protein
MNFLQLWSYGKAGALALTGILTVGAIRHYVNDVSWDYLNLIAQFLPVPVVFALWLRAVCPTGGQLHRHSLLYAGLAMIAFCIASSPASHEMRRLCLFTGTALALCVYVSPQRFWVLYRDQPRAFFVAAFLASGYALYPIINQSVWFPLCKGTATVLAQLFDALGMNVGTYEYRGLKMMLESPQFKINVHAPCSGFEGMLLFLGLYHAVVLWDYKLFSKTDIWGISLVFCFIAFVVNTIRIGALFLLGYFAYDPNAGEVMASFRGASVELFHSTIGFALYLLVFSLLMRPLYDNAYKCSQR